MGLFKPNVSKSHHPLASILEPHLAVIAPPAHRPLALVPSSASENILVEGHFA